MEPFIHQQRDGAPDMYTIDKWMSKFPGLTAGFTGRGGGVSQGPWESLNCGLHVGDKPENVVENRRRLADAVGIPFAQWTYGEQVHGCDVQTVDVSHFGRGTHSREDAFQEKDAFITCERGIGLAGMFADCVPIYFVDPVNRAVGLAHAGWKGTVLKVAEKTVLAMAEQYGSKLEELYAAIGPSIGGCCYEVDDRIVERVRQDTGLNGEPFVQPSNDGKYRLNLQEINRQIMIEAGILPYRIEITKRCTGCNTRHFFSHRKENGNTGRMVAWIGWK